MEHRDYMEQALALAREAAAHGEEMCIRDRSCTQIQRVAGWLQKPQIGAVGVIHRQQCAVLPAHLRQSGNVRHLSLIHI